MTQIIPIASGKGGVGKTLTTSNLGLALAQAGKTCIVVDLDLGAANLHTFLGIRNTQEGLGHFILRKENVLANLVVETAYPKLHIITGDGLVPGTANLPFYIKKKIQAGLGELVADYILLDLGAGTANNTLDFFLLATQGFLVTAPETTAILNAYAFIKSALFRLLYLSFPYRSRERELVTEFTQNRLEKSPQGLDELCQILSRENPESGLKAQGLIRTFQPSVVMNMGRSQMDFALGEKLREIIHKNLGLTVAFLGYIPWDEDVRSAVNQRIPLLQLKPQAPFSQSLYFLRDKILHTPSFERSELLNDPVDLEELQNFQEQFSEL